MGSKVLFLVRDKLGDTLIAAALAIAWARAHPEAKAVLMVRSAYLPLLQGEEGVRLVPYRNAAQAYLWALLTRLSPRAYDALVVLRGFGSRIARFGRLVKAKRKIHFNGRWSGVFPEYPPPLAVELERDSPIRDASVRAIQILSPDFAAPDTLFLPSLANRRHPAASRDGFVGICPLTDEARKNLSPAAIGALIGHLRQLFPGRSLRILIRQQGEAGFFAPAIDGVPVVEFKSVDGLLAQFSEMGAYFGADTGLFHVAAAMGIPSQIVFGPTQPQKILFPGQAATAWRLRCLGDRHCDSKDCITPVCIDQAAANLVGFRELVPIPAEVPTACPLRARAPSELGENQRYGHGRWESCP